MATYSQQLRRGLPRVPGGQPWPPAQQPAVQTAGEAASADTPMPSDSPEAKVPAASEAAKAATSEPTVESTSAQNQGPAATSRQVLGDSEIPLRRGLPRTPGGEPWPPGGFAPLVEPRATAASSTEQRRLVEPVAAPEPSVTSAPSAPAAEQPAPVPAAQKETVPESQPAAEGTLEPAAAPTKTETAPAVAKPAAAEKEQKPKREPVVIGSRSLGQWTKLVGLILIGAVLGAGILILAARGVTTLPGVSEFLERYTGVYEIPDVAEERLPVWARWAHYLNFFFLLLIIRTGLLVRTQQKPDAFYTPKKGGKKVSIYLWLHTSVDILWLLNGLAFVVTLFATGHWQRVVPTSWEVFPNAASALLQYMSLDWPTYEAGWVYYNSLQELMYFTVIFIAAPLAVITGLRMTQWWPQDAKTLNRIYPTELARALHYPVMLFFVLFVIVHVAMVFATGALKNLNAMFYGADEPSWVGFWIFAAGLAAAIGAVLLARPLVIAPIASLFGRISNR